MKCDYFELKKCLSCQWIDKSYQQQISDKQTQLCDKLRPFAAKSILEPIQSTTNAFRNKAKMAVLGTVERPILGIITAGEPVDLCDCPLYSAAMQKTLSQVKALIKQLQLVPYNIRRKKGEIKFVILTEADGQFMLRLVLRSDKERVKITQAIDNIQQTLPQLAVISINIQPEHAAILEGEQEFVLTTQQQLPIKLNHVPLFIQTGSFFQTNTIVASQLYATAQQWLASLPINTIWDLFCGVGGFGLHCITPKRELVGIEINPQAIECAKRSASLMNYQQITFKSLDATKFALSALESKPELILVNPPRRGLGPQLVNYLQQISPSYILYSSCNLDSLVTDLTYFEGYSLECVQLFDMFPHTEHMEVLLLLKKITGNR